MLKKSASSTLDTREAYLVKRRSFPDSDVSRFTNDVDGLSEHPVRGFPVVQDVRTIELLFGLG